MDRTYFHHILGRLELKMQGEIRGGEDDKREEVYMVEERNLHILDCDFCTTSSCVGTTRKTS
jgi:hypothetical protein